MIYYFSGTGNSYAAAKALADSLQEPLQDIAQAVKNNSYSYTLSEGERLGFVFPVYAWAPPKIVLDFIRQLKLQFAYDPYVFAVCTFGASAGKSIDFLEDVLAEKGLLLNSGFSVVMPDNCITLFPAESEKAIREKLSHAEKTIHRIQKAIRMGKTGFFRVKRGKFAGTLSHVVNPLFQKGGMKTKAFYVTDQCTGCGLCEQLCTSGCIRMTVGKPVWTEDTCNMCLACLHRCPVTAIQYGKKTIRRARYLHPIYQKKGDE